MKAFRFPLQRVQDWRALQLKAEEEKLAMLQQRLVSLTQREAALAEALSNFRLNLLAAATMAGSDLQGLAAYQSQVHDERTALKQSRAACQTLIAVHIQRVLKARQDYHVLEKLKEKQWKEWSYRSDLEVESTAAEAYLAKWPLPE